MSFLFKGIDTYVIVTIVMKNPDHPSMFLVPYLMELAESCKEAKLSFLILNESINKLNEPFPQIPDDAGNWEREEECWATYRRSWTMKRIALHSFILSAANISKIVWPYIDKKLEEPKRRRMLKRGQYLEKFFPKNDYPNLKKKQFRNFLEHFDERLDNWDETDQAHNIVMDSVGKNTVSGNVTIMQNFDLHTYEIRYYNGTKTETADIRAIYYEIEKLCQQIPGAFAEIYKRPLDFYKHFIEL